LNPYYRALEFTSIIGQLTEHALSEQAKKKLSELTPCLNEDICRRKMAETTAARIVLDSCGSPPLASMRGLEELLGSSELGMMLMPEQLSGIAQFSTSCNRMVSYLKRGEACGQDIALFGRNIEDLSDLHNEITACVNVDKIYDHASTELSGIRRKTERLQAQIKEKLTHILQSRKQYLAENYISIRNGHYVLPVKRQFQNQFGGALIEVSGKGSTVFMEPASVNHLQAELTQLSVEEDNEIRRILFTLTAKVAEYAPAIRRNMEIMEMLDVLFAKAKYSAAIRARAVDIGSRRQIKILQGRHPLLNAEDCVPLDFIMDETTSGVIITGPNTGGKTVAIKTVGLLSMMAQCGLHIPCGEDSYIAMQDGYWCDIGDSQNISQNLSTFSGHISNVIDILENASCDSLVLLDELGCGTDPAEGMGIAIAVLEELRKRGCMFLVTTHYPQVKNYAEQNEDILSARMAFDQESLQPLYRMEMGKSGESCALYIAERLGLRPHLLERAYQEVYGKRPNTVPAKEAMKPPVSKLVRTVQPKNAFDPSTKFSMGDCVMVLPEKETGVVYRAADQNGNVVVQVKGVKRLIRHTRLQLQVAAAELYPPDYDFSIVFDTVENRKARKILGKRHDPALTIKYEPEDYK